MKNAMIVFAAVALVVGLTASVSAGEPAGAVPATTLSSMGFGGVEIMSDADGLAIRGKGTYAYVWGNSSASYHGRNGQAWAYNEYGAGVSHRHGSSTAVGGSFSFAGNYGSGGGGGPAPANNVIGPHHGPSLNVNISGGGAFAYAR